MCGIISLELPTIMEEIKADYSTHSIDSICFIGEDFNVKFKCFKLAEPLLPILNSYFLLSSKYPSDLFDCEWTTALKSVSKQNLILSEVVSTVWNPVFTKCNTLINKMRERSITLGEVDDLFRGQDKNQIYFSIKYLYQAIEECNGTNESNPEWIKDFITHMEQYWTLCEQAEAATTVLVLKASLKLTGNFEIIEHVASRVTESMADAPLSVIDSNLACATTFLKELSGKKENLQSLQKFVLCADIVDWIRKETKG